MVLIGECNIVYDTNKQTKKPYVRDITDINGKFNDKKMNKTRNLWLHIWH